MKKILILILSLLSITACFGQGQRLFSIGDGSVMRVDKIGLTDIPTITAVKGGTGLTSYVVGDILFANSTTTLTKLAGVATGNSLLSGGIGVAPSWGKIGLTTHISGILPVANGGTNLSALGTANQLIRVNSGATALEYFTPTFLTSEVDGLTTNEGALSVGAAGANTSQIITNTSGDGGIILKGGTNITLTESADTITITATGTAGTAWVLGGQNTTANANIGPNDAFRFGIITNGTPRLYFSSDGRMFAGTLTDVILPASDSVSISGNTIDVSGNTKFANNIVANGATSVIVLKGYTVATLPVAPPTGSTAYVTDATAPTYLGTLTGGGAVVCPVFYNGVVWVSH